MRWSRAKASPTWCSCRAASRPCIRISLPFSMRYGRGVTFQPVQDAGRNENFDKDRDRVVLSEIRRRIVEESAVFGPDDMIPLPCNPESISIAYGLRNGGKVVPIMSLLPREELVASLPNAINFEKQPALLRKFMELFSLSSGPQNAGARMGELLCCLPQVPIPSGIGYA